MIYALLNIFLFFILIYFSSFADMHSDATRSKQLISPILILSVAALINALSILCNYWGNPQIAGIAGKIYVFIIAFFNVFVTSYICRFPSCKNTGFDKVITFLLITFAFFISFFKITKASTSIEFGLVVEASYCYLFGVSWDIVYEILFVAGLPAISVLSLLLRLEVTKNKLHRQQMVLLALTIILGWVSFFTFGYISDIVSPSFALLLPFALAFEIYLLYNIVLQSVLYDFKTMVATAFDFTINYIVLGVLAGICYTLLQPLREYNVALFVLVYVAIVFVLLAVRYQLTKFLEKFRRNRTTNYIQQFEQDLVSLDYTESPDVLFETFRGYFKDNVHTDDVDFLVESPDGGLETLYSSRNKKFKIPAKSPIFSCAINAKKTVIFKSHVETKRYLLSAKRELNDLFNETESEALILLTEGGHVFSAMLLGEKHLGNEYTDYDFAVFNRFYSYFFVFGYYLKNITNESVVGTVNREIQMSGQIIQSIQENMDFIKNPKADVGYISVAAHNLGGEYVDFIKLNEDKHMFVLGDISGKGINASMSSVIIKSIVRTFLAETRDFKQLVQKVNAFIRNNLPKGTFFAGVFGLIDFSENTLYYLNCGVPALLMYNQSYNNVIEIQGEGRVLGFVKNIEKLIKVKKVKLNPGDIVLACTDGLLNAKNIRGEKFGKDRIQQSIVENLFYPADKMSQFLHDQLLDFTSKELEDDVSVVTIKYLSK